MTTVLALVVLIMLLFFSYYLMNYFENNGYPLLFTLSAIVFIFLLVGIYYIFKIPLDKVIEFIFNILQSAKIH